MRCLLRNRDACMRAGDVPRKWVVEGEAAHFGLLDGFRQRCFSILTPPHCGTNYTAVLCELCLLRHFARPLRCGAARRADGRFRGWNP